MSDSTKIVQVDERSKKSTFQISLLICQSDNAAQEEELDALLFLADRLAKEKREGPGSQILRPASSESLSKGTSQSLSNPLSEEEKEGRLPFLSVRIPFNANFLLLWLETPDDEDDVSVEKPALSAPDSRLRAVGTASRIVS